MRTPEQIKEEGKRKKKKRTSESGDQVVLEEGVKKLEELRRVFTPEEDKKPDQPTT